MGMTIERLIKDLPASMTIEQIIKYLPAPMCGATVIGKEMQKYYDAHDLAVIILRKYQKIQEIMDELNGNFYGSYLKDRQTLEKIYEVLEDGKSD